MVGTGSVLSTAAFPVPSMVLDTEQVLNKVLWMREGMKISCF